MTVADDYTPSPDFIAPLLRWFREAAAELPWRSTRDPYRIWLSEIMLQQTQIVTVIPYYEKFIAAYPRVHDLAAAEQSAVLKRWEGLGYYSRARNLHKTAQIVATEYGGTFPTTAEGLQNLPGIGRYTAGAIASIAYAEPAPVLDGNVIRVFARLFDIPDDVRAATTKTRLWTLAERLVPAEKPGDYNQALMELGQTICTPRRPRCDECPVRAHCRAFAAGTQAERPVKSKRAPTPHYDVTAGIIRDDTGHILIAQRPQDKLLGGLWEFPGGKQEPHETLEDCLARELREELGIRVAVGLFFMQVKHAFTHFKITLHVFECRYLPEGGPPQALGCAAWQWVSEGALNDYAFGKADRQIILELAARKSKLL
ncbi:MAG: A/G-specific adenine glycosylase [Anaerolineales bacterium]